MALTKGLVACQNLTWGISSKCEINSERETLQYEWVQNYTKREDKIQGRGTGQIMQFICNVTEDLNVDTNATHLCFYEPIGIRLSNIKTPNLPGKYGPINVKLFNMTYFTVTINFKPIPRINYTLLYEENFWVVIGPSYLNDEGNQMFKEYYPIKPVDKRYDFEMSILMTF